MSLEGKLKTLISDNFVVYFKTHAYHHNIVGPDFDQYHRLLDKVYTALFDWHDLLSEQLRQLDVMCFTSLEDIADLTNFNLANKAKNGKSMLMDTADSLDNLIVVAQALYDEAGTERNGALETCIGDYMKDISKLHWKVKSSCQS